VLARNGAGLSHRGDDGEARKLVGAIGERHSLLKAEKPNTQAVIRAEITGSEQCSALGLVALQCSALGLVARSSSPVLLLCRLLVAAGHAPGTALEAWRGDVLSLPAARLPLHVLIQKFAKRAARVGAS
jgi:hypothetical protein